MKKACIFDSISSIYYIDELNCCEPRCSEQKMVNQTDNCQKWWQLSCLNTTTQNIFSYTRWIQHKPAVAKNQPQFLYPTPHDHQQSTVEHHKSQQLPHNHIFLFKQFSYFGHTSQLDSLIQKLGVIEAQIQKLWEQTTANDVVHSNQQPTCTTAKNTFNFQQANVLKLQSTYVFRSSIIPLIIAIPSSSFSFDFIVFIVSALSSVLLPFPGLVVAPTTSATPIVASGP